MARRVAQRATCCDHGARRAHVDAGARRSRSSCTRESVERIWLPHYPPGVPADIHPEEYASLLDMLDRAVSFHRDRPAFTSMGCTLTYGDVDRLATCFA